jgi:toxin ParE1/3/4
MAARFSVLLSHSAERDVLNIGRYVAEHADIETALRVMDGLDACWSKLSQFPNRGNIPKELHSVGKQDLRELHYKPWRIFYRIQGNRVMVHAVTDGRRNMEEFLRNRLSQID